MITAPYKLVTVPLAGPEMSAPYGDELAGRRAWLLTRGDPTLREARLEGTTGDPRSRERCTWSRLGDFRDRTEAHVSETLALVRELSAKAPPGYRAELRSTERGWFVLFHGAPGNPAAMFVEVSDAARVRAHWKTYLPEVRPSERGGGR